MKAGAARRERAREVFYTFLSICLAGACILVVMASAPATLLLPLVLAAAALARLVAPGKALAARPVRAAALLLAAGALFLPATAATRTALAGAALFLLLYHLLGEAAGREEPGRPALLPAALLALAWAGAARLLPEIRTLDRGTLLESLVLWTGVLLLAAAAALLLRRARPPRAAGPVLLLLLPLACAFTLHRLEGLTDVHGVGRSLEALGALVPLGPATPFLPPGARPPLLRVPSPWAVALLQLGLLAPLLLLAGAAAGALGPLPRRSGWALALALGAATGPWLPWPLLAAAGPALGLLALGRRGKGARGPAAGRLLALLLLGAALAGAFGSGTPPRLAAPLALGGGRVPRACWAGRLGLAAEPGAASFLDGCPQGLTSRQEKLLAAVAADPGGGGGVAFLPPGVEAHPSWDARPLLGAEPPPGHPLPGAAGGRLLVLPDPRHRRLAALLAGSRLAGLGRDFGLCRLVLRLDRLGPAEIALLCRRLVRTGAFLRLEVGLDRLTPPLLLFTWREEKEGGGCGPTPGWRTLARGAGASRLAAAAPSRPFAAWALAWAPRVRPALAGTVAWLARAAEGAAGSDPATAVALRVLAARWDPERPDAWDPMAHRVPTAPELALLDEAARAGADPWLLDHMAAAGEELLHPKVQLLERARPHLERWHRLFPGRADFARLLGTLRVRLLEHAAALPLLQRARRLQPGERKTWRELGLAHFGLAQYAAAAHWLEQADPDPRRDPEAVRALALSLHRSGRPGAAPLLRALQAQGPLDEEAKKALHPR